MWVFLKGGHFLSAVAHDSKRGVVLVRARRSADLEALGVPEHTPRADYAWRIEVPQKRWARWLALQAKHIDYPNFKDTVTDDDRHRACMDVWWSMLALQRPELFEWD